MKTETTWETSERSAVVFLLRNACQCVHLSFVVHQALCWCWKCVLLAQTGRCNTAEEVVQGQVDLGVGAGCLKTFVVSVAS